MKKYLILLTIGMSTVPCAFSQHSFYDESKTVNDGAIYLTFDGKKIEFAANKKEKPDGRDNLKDSLSFSVKDQNSCAIYLKWINPLKYELNWSDSTYTDPRDKMVSDFVDLLTAQFGSPVTSLGKNESKMLIARTKGASKFVEITDVETNGFYDVDLTQFYIQLKTTEPALTTSDNFDDLVKLLSDLDSCIVIDAKKEIEQAFTNFLLITESGKVAPAVSKAKEKMIEWNEVSAKIDELQKDILKLLPKTTIKDNPLMNNYLNLVVLKFIDKTKTINQTNKVLASKLKPIIELFDNSIKEESENPLAKGYFKVHNPNFENGKKTQTVLQIKELEYTPSNMETASKQTPILKRTFSFQKFDPCVLSVSTGIFYANTTLRGYGVSSSVSGQFSVTEDDINKDNAVPAVFLNFNFNVGDQSRYFSPLLQIGVDPTKKRPFLLVGTGFSIPSARFAISGGPIWTWNQSLDELEVGQDISSTTDLEKDLKYQFQTKPVGWYLGIQYNF